MEEINQIIRDFDNCSYIASEELATILYLSKQLSKPLLLEGNPGVGKTTLAKALADSLNTNLIRLQCYEGLDVNNAIYEWNYQKQLLQIKILENKEISVSIEKEIFGREYLLERPLLQSLTNPNQAPVLLIDEIDRADEEFEAYLLEILSDFQVSIPELGTITASHKPFVILTSNRTRDLSDALKRRCLYHWLDYPSKEKELQIILKIIPEIQQKMAICIVDFIHDLRLLKLNKTPGVAETIDWAKTIILMKQHELNPSNVIQSLGVLLKNNEDFNFVKNEFLDEYFEKKSA